MNLLAGRPARLVGGALSLLLSAPALAQGKSTSEAPARIQFAGNLALGHQFNGLADVTYADGSTETLGDAVLGLNAGATFPLTRDGQYEVQALFGFLFSKLNASNGTLSFLEFPLEVTAHVNLWRFLRIGAGPTLHISPMIRGDGIAGSSDVNFGTTLGAVVRVEARLNRTFGFGLDYNWLKLSANGQSMDASRIGGVLSLYL